MGAGASARGSRRRPRIDPHRRDPRARQRHPAGRVPRREGGHGRSPRRARPAASPGDRSPGPGPRGLVGDRGHRQARRPRPARAHQRNGVQAAGRGGAVLRGTDARGDRRSWGEVAGARAGVALAAAGPRPGKALRPAREPRGGAKERQRRAFASARTGRSGPRPRSTSRRRSSTPSPASRSSSRPRMRRASASGRATRCWYRRTEPGSRRMPTSARASPPAQVSWPKGSRLTRPTP